MEGKFPLKTRDLQWSREGDAYVLVDNALGKSFRIDPVSFLVWVQCDGKTSVEEIIDVFTVDGNRDIIKAAVTGVLEKLTTGGLISWV